MADGRSTSQEVPYHNSTSYQQYPIRDGHPPQPQAYTTSNTVQSSEMQQPMTTPSTNHIGNAVSSQTSGLSKVSSTGEMDTDNDELFGEKILQNRHVAFPPSQTPNTIIPNSTSHLQTILPQSTTVSQLAHPQNSTSSAPQQLNTITASSDTDNNSQVRGVQRNNSLPNGSHDASSIPQHPPVSPNHESTRMMQIPVNTVVPVSIAVDMTSTTNGQQQVVTKKKGRFKFVEQVPPIQRTSNENLMMNEGTVEQRLQQQVVPVTSMMPSSSNGNLQAFPVPSQPPQSNLPPSGPPEIQPQMLVTTPSVQKKGRFVVTTLPTPVALTNGSIPASSVQQHQPQQQVHAQQPVVEQAQHHPPGIPTTGTTHNVDATHARRPSDDITNASTNIAIQHAASQYMYPPNEGINAPLNGPLVSSYPPPPPPPPQATLSTGQSPGHTLPHPNSNSENNSPITSQASSYMPGNTIIDDSMVQAAVVHYDTIQGSSSLPSSRQVSPKVVSKPVPARHNTTGMAITTNGTSGSGTSNSNNNNNNNANNNSSFLLAAPSQRLQQQQQQQPPGFGKMLYFLDQMKLEVTEADQSIKNLQTEMKCLKEKNKELEAKARDMERKFNQEKALREVAETRVKALKKKIRVYESTTSNGSGIATSTTPATTTTNGSGGGSSNHNGNNAFNLHQHQQQHHNPNETSIDMGYGSNGVIVVGSNSHTTRDDESVGTNQTYEKQPQQIYQQQQPPPPPSYSDQIQ